MNNLTLVTCSYNTPQVVFTLLASFNKYHPGPHKILLYENSTNDLTQKLLDHNEVPYIFQLDGRHHESVERAIQECTTRYALVVDSDVVFRRSIEPIFEMFKAKEVAALGQVVASRCDYKLYPRIQPWFMLLDIEQIRAKNIHFTDWNKIVATGSEGFFQSPPVQHQSTKLLYDVGATFYEDMCNAGLEVYDWLGDPKYFHHYEGMSWRPKIMDKPIAFDAAKITVAYWSQDTQNLMNLSIKGAYEK